jgi:hypothetical protein
MINKEHIIDEVSSYIARICDSDRDLEALQTAIQSYKQSKNYNEFRFNVEKVYNSLFVDLFNQYVEQRAAMMAEHDKHRSHLWTDAVIQSTSVKHNDPIEYAYKVLSEYDKLFVKKY